MIDHPAFIVEPWCLRETELHLGILSQTESVFALSNGHIGLRGNLDEGEPHGRSGSYLNGVYELRPLPYAEAGYGYPESGQTVINVTNGKLIRLLVDDEPFDVRYGNLKVHERALDMRAGTLSRRARWVSPAHREVDVSSVRLVSLSQRSIAAIEYRVQAVDTPIRVVVQSGLVANETLPPRSKDPRDAAPLHASLQPEVHAAHGTRLELVHRTRHSRIGVAAAADHTVVGPGTVGIVSECDNHTARLSATTTLQPGEVLRVVKYLAYGWSAQRSVPALRDQVVAALLAAQRCGWDGLLREQRTYLDAFWDRADVTVSGDADVQQAVRFGLFQVLQAGARAEQRAIPAKGLTGEGYDGHAFWDTETFVLPVLTYTQPTAAGDALRWRHSTLPLAQERAEQLGLAGAAFPWRTIAGQECSAYWPAGTAAFHVNADIAAAAMRYVAATGDQVFEEEVGVELLVASARLWMSLGHHEPSGTFRIDGVTGPDEYSAIADNNVFTNLMAQANLVGAADAVGRYPGRARALGVDAEEAAAWRDAAARMCVPYDDALGVHPQAEEFTSHRVWDFEHSRPDQYPLLLHFPYFDLYRKQVVKQADLVLALHLRGDAFSADEKARDFAYYEALTVRDSSLSACTQAVVAAEVGHLDLAWRYLRETALIDLYDLQDNTRDGLHLASLAGTWLALVAGFGGFRDHDGKLTFAPRLPPLATHLAFSLLVRGSRLRVEIDRGSATYSVVEGASVHLAHHGEALTVSADNPVTRPLPPAPERPEPRQPKGREPR